MLQFLEPYIAQILGTAGLIFGYLLGFRKRKAETKKVEIDIKSIELKNLNDTFSLYEKLLDNLEAKFEGVNEDLARLKKVHERTKELLEKCKREKEELEKENLKLFQKLKTCQE